jgi:hypothetical protein
LAKIRSGRISPDAACINSFNSAIDTSQLKSYYLFFIAYD